MAVPYAFGFKSCLNTFLLFFFPPLRQLDVASYALGQNFDSMILINWKINPHRGVKGLIRSKEVNRNVVQFSRKNIFFGIYTFLMRFVLIFSILRTNYSNFDLLQSSKISWIRIYYLSRDLINPEGLKNFNIEKEEQDWFNPFFDIPKLISFMIFTFFPI